VAKKGEKRPIFEGNMPPKKCTSNIGADIGAITGILLILNSVTFAIKSILLTIILWNQIYTTIQKKTANIAAENNNNNITATTATITMMTIDNKDDRQLLTKWSPLFNASLYTEP
jgi:hypothetical protein